MVLFRAVMTRFVASGCVALPRGCWVLAFCSGRSVDVIAPAAVGHVVAAGSNKRLQKAALVSGWVVPAGSRGSASILRPPAAVAS